MLKPSDTIKEIKTGYPIDMILYDSELAKEIDELKHAVSTVSNGYELQSIGK